MKRLARLLQPVELSLSSSNPFKSGMGIESRRMSRMSIGSVAMLKMQEIKNAKNEDLDHKSSEMQVETESEYSFSSKKAMTDGRSSIRTSEVS